MGQKIVLLSGSASKPLAERISEKSGIELIPVEKTDFSDGEFKPTIQKSIRGCQVVIIQSTNPPAENLLELLMLIDASKRGSAAKIVVVMPYFGFARQERKDKPRVPITAKLIANLVQVAGADHGLFMDLHADQIGGFFDVPVDHLYASAIFIPHIQSLQLDNLAIASPDTGGSNRAGRYAKFLSSDMVLFYKTRSKPNEISDMRLVGDVKGKNVIFLDDIIDTAGTLTNASKIAMENGALSVRAMCTHAVLSGSAFEKIEKSPFTEVIVTDTIPLREGAPQKIKVLSTAELFSEAIKRIKNYESISSLFAF